MKGHSLQSSVLLVKHTKEDISCIRAEPSCCSCLCASHFHKSVSSRGYEYEKGEWEGQFYYVWNDSAGDATQNTQCCCFSTVQPHTEMHLC